jgi:hypothetical protein
MKIVVIFIRENTELFPTSGQGPQLSQVVQSYPLQNGWRRIQISQDRELWIHHVEWKPEQQEWQYIRDTLKSVSELYVALHSTTMSRLSSQIETEFRKTFSEAQVFVNTFSRVEGNDIWRHFSDLVVAVQNRESLFDQVAEAIKKKLTLTQRLSILKHRIAHLFLPIDIDLQGLIETGFREDYWNEVVEAYRDGKAVGKLAQARQLLYGTQGEEDTVEKVKEDAKKNAPTDQMKKRIDDAWEGVGTLLPNSNNPKKVDPDFEMAKTILEGLQRRERDSVKALCKDRSNPFHQWFVKLNKALDELREALLKEGSTGT